MAAKGTSSCLPFHRSTVRSISSKLWSYDGDVGSSFGSANFSKYLRIVKWRRKKNTNYYRRGQRLPPPLSVAMHLRVCQRLFGSDSFLGVQLEHLFQQVDRQRVGATEYGAKVLLSSHGKWIDIIACLQETNKRFEHTVDPQKWPVIQGKFAIITLSDEILDMKSSGGVPSTSIIKFNCCISEKSHTRAHNVSIDEFLNQWRISQMNSGCDRSLTIGAGE